MSEAYQISVNILSVDTRPCRRYQERISEYAMNGSPRFVWETMRHNMILYEDQQLPMTCAMCDLNIMQAPEGCKATLYGLDIFLRAVARLAPDSPWNAIEFSPEPLSMAATEELANDLEELDKLFSRTDWKVAQIYREGDAVMDYFEDGSSRPRIFPWNGEAPPHLINSNEGYQLFMCNHGLVVKSNFEDPVPYVFTKLVRDAAGVTGYTAQGERVSFPSTMARYPEWDKEFPRAFGELRVMDMNAGDVFRDTIDMLIVFTGIALSSKTGIILANA